MICNSSCGSPTKSSFSFFCFVFQALPSAQQKLIQGNQGKTGCKDLWRLLHNCLRTASANWGPRVINYLKQTDEEVQQIDKQIEAEAAASPPEEEEESFVPKKGSFMKEDVILKKEMNDIMKNVLSETS